MKLAALGSGLAAILAAANRLPTYPRTRAVGEVEHRITTIKGVRVHHTPLKYQPPKPDRSKYTKRLCRKLRQERGVGRPPGR